MQVLKTQINVLREIALHRPNAHIAFLYDKSYNKLYNNEGEIFNLLKIWKKEPLGGNVLEQEFDFIDYTVYNRRILNLFYYNNMTYWTAYILNDPLLPTYMDVCLCDEKCWGLLSVEWISPFNSKNISRVRYDVIKKEEKHLIIQRTIYFKDKSDVKTKTWNYKGKCADKKLRQLQDKWFGYVLHLKGERFKTYEEMKPFTYTQNKKKL